MPNKVSDKTLYLNADRTKVVDEGSEDAAFLLVREGGVLSAEDAERYGISGEDEVIYDAKRDHYEKHGGQDPTLDVAGRAAMLRGEDDPDGPAAPGERGNVEEAAQTEEGDGPAQGDAKAARPAANKARTAAENK